MLNLPIGILGNLFSQLFPGYHPIVIVRRASLYRFLLNCFGESSYLAFETIEFDSRVHNENENGQNVSSGG